MAGASLNYIQTMIGNISSGFVMANLIMLGG